MQNKTINNTYWLGGLASIRLTEKNVNEQAGIYACEHSHSWAGSQSPSREWTRPLTHCGTPWCAYDLLFFMLKSVFTLTHNSIHELHSSTIYNRTSTFLAFRAHACGISNLQGVSSRVFFTISPNILDVVINPLLHGLTAKTKILQTLLQDVLFADDYALIAHAEQDLQRMLGRFSKASKLFGLTISLGKTEVLHQPAPYSHPTITIDDKPLANIEHFKYLGSTIYCDDSSGREIDNRISKASQALGSLHNQVLSEYNICLSMKLKAYNAMVLPSLLYVC